MKKLLSLTFAVFIAVSSLCGCSGKTEETNAPPESKSIKLVTLGDNLMHMPVVNSGKKADGSYDYSHIFQNLQPYISDADIAVIGQETIFGGASRGYSGYPLFNSPEDVGKSLAAEGFDIVLHATNHTMDQTAAGVENTLKFWQSYPEVKVLGIHGNQKEYDTIDTIDCQGVKIGLLNYTYGTNGMPPPQNKPYLVNLIDEEKIERDAYFAEKGTDFTVAFMHWGEENIAAPTNSQKELAKKMCSWGVDLIIGSHPHVIHPAEWIESENGNKTLVFYSLGNFVSRQLETRNLLGGIADVTLKVDNGKVSIDSASFVPVVTHYNSACTEFTVYPLKDYSEKLAQTHGLNSLGDTLSLERLENIMYDTFKGYDDKIIDY